MRGRRRAGLVGSEQSPGGCGSREARRPGKAGQRAASGGRRVPDPRGPQEGLSSHLPHRTFTYILRELPKVPPHVPVCVLGNYRDMGEHRVVLPDDVRGLIDGLDRWAPAGAGAWAGEGGQQGCPGTGSFLAPGWEGRPHKPSAGLLRPAEPLGRRPRPGDGATWGPSQAEGPSWEVGRRGGAPAASRCCPREQAAGLLLLPLRRVLHEEQLRPEVPSQILQHPVPAAPGGPWPAPPTQHSRCSGTGWGRSSPAPPRRCGAGPGPWSLTPRSCGAPGHPSGAEKCTPGPGRWPPAPAGRCCGPPACPPWPQTPPVARLPGWGPRPHCGPGLSTAAGGWACRRTALPPGPPPGQVLPGAAALRGRLCSDTRGRYPQPPTPTPQVLFGRVGPPEPQDNRVWPGVCPCRCRHRGHTRHLRCHAAVGTRL